MIDIVNGVEIPSTELEEPAVRACTERTDRDVTGQHPGPLEVTAAAPAGSAEQAAAIPAISWWWHVPG